MKLDAYEKNIETTLEKGEWQSIANLSKKRDELKKIATKTIAKTKRITLRITEHVKLYT